MASTLGSTSYIKGRRQERSTLKALGKLHMTPGRLSKSGSASNARRKPKQRPKLRLRSAKDSLKSSKELRQRL